MKLRCGDRVTERCGRHVARVEAINNSSTIRVRWEDTGWLSEYRLRDDDLVVVQRARG